MSLCAFPALRKGTRCIHCERTLTHDMQRHPVAMCGFKQGAPPPHADTARRVARDPLACLHLIENTGEVVEQLKCGCPGSKMTGVWSCELHGRCAPLARVGTFKEEGITACRWCPNYTAEVTPASAPAAGPQSPG